MKNQESKPSKDSQNGMERQHDENKATITESQLRELFEDELKDMSWTKKALSKSIPNMISKATSEELIIALIDQLDETRSQVERNARIFASIETKPEANQCEAMNGLIKEGDDMMDSCEKGAMRDAGIISAAQKIEHYEIAAYTTLCQYAQTLGLYEAVRLLKKTLGEGKGADDRLSDVATNTVNLENSQEEA